MIYISSTLRAMVPSQCTRPTEPSLLKVTQIIVRQMLRASGHVVLLTNEKPISAAIFGRKSHSTHFLLIWIQTDKSLHIG